MKTIEIIVSPSGQTTLQTNGFSGNECLQASRFLEQAIGKRITEKLTSSYHQQSTQQQVDQQEQQ